MGFAQLLIIVAFSGFTAWLVAWLIIKIIFAPVRPIRIGPVTIQGVLPAKQNALAEKIGAIVQKEFLSYKGIDEKIADPALFQKLRPEIEKHVDVFLQEKLSSVFPLLSKFMGEKTLNQFKVAFLLEIDLLFPALMKNYTQELKNGLDIGAIVSDKIRSASIINISKTVYASAKKEIFQFKLICTCIGLLISIAEVFILRFVH